MNALGERYTDGSVFDDATTPRGTSEPPLASSWFLIVSSSGALGTRLVAVDDGHDVVVGRHAGCEVRVDHDAVSRKHATFRRDGDHVSVSDCGSRNGTLVNGTPIQGSRRLTAGDVVTIGPVTAILASASPSRVRKIATLGEFEDRLEAEVDRAVRYQRPLALVMLRPEGAPELVAMHVETLAGQLRRMDLLAEYSADELALLLPETNLAAAEHVARRVRTSRQVKIHVGLACFPTDGSHAGELVTAAHERLRGARRPARRATTAGLDLSGRRVIAADPQMKHVFALAKRVAPSPITVLITGETGVGKEAVAEAVHRLGPRGEGPYVRLNCASLSESLVESALFGHEAGAFTGAKEKQIGFFEAASGGTLFLDEIGELPAASQVKLLRVLEQRRIVRVGGTSEIPVDVRLVCATHRDLEAETERARFREDLYFRISAFVIPVPPLRDRRGEIPLLAKHFATELANELAQTPPKIDDEALAMLVRYDWPGNVRELRNVIERAAVMSRGGKIDVRHLPEKLRERAAFGGRSQAVRHRLGAIERDSVIAALDAHDGNQTHAAKQLGISRFALIRLMDKHDLKPRRS